MNYIRIELGASSYFSRPRNDLDPHLFLDKEHIRPDVRETILDTLLGYLATRYTNPKLWVMAWLAGSGISYQWAASRGNGDLDVLFGIDYSQFVTCNPAFQWMDRHEISSAITDDLRKNLWPRTSHTNFNGQTYTVTFFLNDYVEADPSSIVNIRPYAAYNLTRDEWTVRPPNLPSNVNLESVYPVEYHQQAAINDANARALVNRYNTLRAEGTMIAPGSPQAINNQRHMALVRAEARNLFDYLHLGRKTAFSSMGEGYGDFANFQWQAGKRSGIVNALNEIINQEY